MSEIQVLTVRQTAEILQCRPATIYHLIREDDLPAFRVGRAYRLTRAALEEWIREQSRPENDAWGRELDRVSRLMRTDAQDAGLTELNAEGRIAQAVERIRTRKEQASACSVCHQMSRTIVSLKRR
jgi:excisionase family DNA binding protein